MPKGAMRLIGKVEAVMAKNMSEDREAMSSEDAMSPKGNAVDHSEDRTGSAPNDGEKATVGSILRSAREARGDKTIPEIAEDIRVRPHQLQALENDDYDKLPGMIYATGFIRTYAKYLDLDGEDLVDRFRRSARTENLEARLAFPQPMEDPRIPRRSLVAVACTLALAVYGTWYGLSGTDEAGFEEVPTVESRLAGVLEDTDVKTDSVPRDDEIQSGTMDAPSSGTASTAKPVQVALNEASGEKIAAENIADEDEQAVVPDPLKRPVLAKRDMSVERETDVAAAPDAVTEPARETLQPQVADSVETGFVNAGRQSSTLLRKVSTASGQVAVRAREDAWVRIEGPDSKPVIDTVLRAGEVYEAPAGAEFTMMTGNAGAIDILIDGKYVGALGPKGEIRRHVALDPSAFSSMPAVRQQ